MRQQVLLLLQRHRARATCPTNKLQGQLRWLLCCIIIIFCCYGCAWRLTNAWRWQVCCSC
jgi:hypothetical protein